MNNFLVLCRMFSGILAASERLVFRRGAPRDHYLFAEFVEGWGPHHLNMFPADVLNEHLGLLHAYGAIQNPICFTHRVSPQILFRALCSPAAYDPKIFIFIGRGLSRSPNHPEDSRPFHPAMAQWWNAMNNTRLGLPLAEMSSDQVHRALISYFLSAPVDSCPSPDDCDDLVMLLVHTSPTPAQNNYYRLLVTPHREDYSGASTLYANILELSRFMCHVDEVFEYRFSVSPDNVPLHPDLRLGPPASDRVLRLRI